MDRWQGKIAVVTGASSGIGAQICLDLATAGMQVIGLARRVDRVELLRQQLAPEQRSALHPRQCDVSVEAEVRATFAWIEQHFGCAHVLVNNAGCSRYGSLLGKSGRTAEAPSGEQLRSVLDTNVLGAVFCMQETVRLLDRADGGQHFGHLVNINSLSGHAINRSDEFVATMNVYPVSKFGLTAATEIVRRELNLRDNRRVRVTSISPGLVETEIFEAAGFQVGTENSVFPDRFVGAPHLKVADVSAAVLFVLGAPQHCNVSEIQLRPTGGP